MAEGEIRISAPISLQLAGPFLRRKRMIWLRVRFIKMFDMETGPGNDRNCCCRRVYSSRLLLTTEPGKALVNVDRLIALKGRPRNTGDTSECREN